MAQENKNFRFCAKNVFLTYPHCGLDLNKFMFNANKFLIAKELHQDGDPHIHCFLHFENKINTYNQKYFDIEGYHPNIQSCRNPGNVMAYVRKGGNFFTNMTEEEMKKGTLLGKRELLAEKILEHGLTKKLICECKEVIFLNYENTKKWLELWTGPKNYISERPLDKRRHIWIHGLSNTGKTRSLDRFLRNKTVCEIPTNNDWRGAEYAEIIYSDEYDGFLSIQQLNRLCDGNTKLNTKGGTTSISYPTIIIVSNFNISTAYPKASLVEIQSLHNRFIQYESPLSMLL